MSHSGHLFLIPIRMSKTKKAKRTKGAKRLKSPKCLKGLKGRQGKDECLMVKMVLLKLPILLKFSKRSTFLKFSKRSTFPKLSTLATIKHFFMLIVWRMKKNV